MGSPRLFAGYTNSDFAYIGIGASQELPYPGKLRLREETAEREADTEQARLVPIQLTPERMQSIGVKTGLVESEPAAKRQQLYSRQSYRLNRNNHLGCRSYSEVLPARNAVQGYGRSRSDEQAER